MKAALFYGGRDIRIEELPVPEPGPDEVLVRVRSAGVCGSDLHNYRGNRPPTQSVPWQQGHELAGEIVKLGSLVTGLEPGQRVGIEAEHLIGCGRCRHCLEGQNHLCPDRGIRNGERHGSRGFSEYDVCAAPNVYPLPESISMDAAALLDCYACGVHAINRAPMVPGDTVAIIGAGAIALTLGQVAKASGAGRVLMVATRRQPLDVALASGAADDVVVNSEQSPVDAIRDATDGEGAAITFETVGGNAQLITQAMDMTRRGGVVSILGLFTAPQQIDASVGMARELTLKWSNSFSTWDGVPEYKTALNLMTAGRLNPEPIITHHFPLEQISEAFAAADDKRSSGAIRVMVHA
ncbi:MAG: alcohol dehydrogenase catalytic domain-containing protein [Dehalococcoidia bacterium]